MNRYLLRKFVSAGSGKPPNSLALFGFPFKPGMFCNVL